MLYTKECQLRVPFVRVIYNLVRITVSKNSLTQVNFSKIKNVNQNICATMNAHKRFSRCVYGPRNRNSKQGNLDILMYKLNEVSFKTPETYIMLKIF